MFLVQWIWLADFFSVLYIHEDSLPLTAVCTQAGNYEWTVTPMGLASSPGWCQCIMLRVCDGLKRVRLFIDDIVCFSKNGAEHVAGLKRFLERLTIFNLKLASKKAYIGARVIKFLGHRGKSKDVEPDPEKVEATTKLRMPSMSVSCDHCRVLCRTTEFFCHKCQLLHDLLVISRKRVRNSCLPQNMLK